jgi:2,4-dienoyl-CoA reductase-like NADH-dependent reductase (Old Yellow Enzyme family)
MNIANIKLRNSFLMRTVKTGYGDLDGNISERHLEFWDKRSKHVATAGMCPDRSLLIKLEDKIPVYPIGDLIEV